MKNPRPTLRRLFSCLRQGVLLSLLPLAPVSAATLYWDTNGATAGAGTAADGNWNTTGSNYTWSTSALGTGAAVAFTGGSDVVFSAGTDAATANVTITSGVSVNSITFEEGVVAVGNSGTSTATVGAGGITVNAGAGAASISRATIGGSTTTTAITLNTAEAVTGTSLTLGSSLLTRSANGIVLFRGNNLGLNAAGTVNSANIFLLSGNSLIGSGATGTATVGILQHATGDTSATGSGAGFVTYDTNGVRLLTGSEYSGTLTADTNARITSATASSGTVTVNSLTIGAGGSITGAGTIAVASGDILVTGGANNGLSATLSSASTGSLYINTINDLSAAALAGGGQFYKFGDGTATFSGVDGFITVNAGTFVLTGGTKAKTVTVNAGTFRLSASNAIEDSRTMTVASGGRFELSAGVTETVGNLTGAGTVSGGTGSTFTVGSGNGTSTFSGALADNLALAKTGTGTFTFSGAGTAHGNITVSAGTFALDSAGALTFYIGANGVTNSVGGAGTANFNGTFNFDLSGASLANGNSWTIANVTTQTFAGTFVVAGFNESGNIWTNGTGLSFNEATGILSYSAIPEPATYALLGGAGTLLIALLHRRKSRAARPA